MKNPLLILCCLFPCLALANEDGSEVPVRMAFMPMMGGLNGQLGGGVDVAMGYGHLAAGVRHIGAEELCIMCQDAEEESQTSFLLGVRQEFAVGVLSFKSGFTKVNRLTKENFVSNGSMFSDPQYDLKKYDGFGVPFQFDLVLGGRYLGLDLSFLTLVDGEGGSAGFLIGLPMGLLRG